MTKADAVRLIAEAHYVKNRAKEIRGELVKFLVERGFDQEFCLRTDTIVFADAFIEGSEYGPLQ